MKGKNRENLKILDEKDKQILEILQQNSREKLTVIARKVGLSIDSVHKRIKKLVNSGILYFQALIDPRKVGFPFILSVNVKLHNIKEEEFNAFISYLKAHPRVIELFTMAGDYDIAFVVIARSAEELESLQLEIRQKFSKIISDWKSALTLKVYKFEEYKFL
jgi:Lrp/AsnC family transcriptional regulator for asnA, asnC and gidA